MSYVPVALRDFVLARAGSCCEYCRVSQLYSDVAFHIEHIIGRMFTHPTPNPAILIQAQTAPASNFGSFDRRRPKNNFHAVNVPRHMKRGRKNVAGLAPFSPRGTKRGGKVGDGGAVF